jgi:fumarate reductase subunit C
LSAATQAKLWYAQRISAMVLALCVVVHIATILYAVRGGLTGAEILGRTRGNVAFAAFYVLFVLSAAIHAPIGLARIAEEWLQWRGRLLNMLLAVFAAVLLVTGLSAVWGLYGG